MASRPSPGAVTSPQVQRGKRKREFSGQYGEQQPPPECQKWRAPNANPMEKTQKGHISLQPEERAAFYHLLEEDHIQDFLARDTGLRISDKFLLAMVLAYFKRAGLKTEEYRKYFFAALFLANQVEEEERPFMMEIYPWALGWTWKQRMGRLQDRRNTLLSRMGFYAMVDRASCDMIMAEDPTHWAWMRNRKGHHGWAIRRRNIGEYLIRGPGSSPLSCSLCNAPMSHPIQWEVVGNIIFRADPQEEPESIIKVLVP